jgi:hypothetical protein
MSNATVTELRTLAAERESRIRELQRAVFRASTLHFSEKR